MLLGGELQGFRSPQKNSMWGLSSTLNMQGKDHRCVSQEKKVAKQSHFFVLRNILKQHVWVPVVCGPLRGRVYGYSSASDACLCVRLFRRTTSSDRKTAETFRFRGTSLPHLPVLSRLHDAYFV